MPTHPRKALAISLQTAFVIFVLVSLPSAAFAQRTVITTTNSSAVPVYVDSVSNNATTIIRVFQASNPNGEVIWQWNDPTPSNGHTATTGTCPGGFCNQLCPVGSGNTSNICPGPPLTWDSGNLTSSNKTFSLQFPTADVYPVWCRLHGAAMQGTVVVQDYSFNIPTTTEYSYVGTAATFNGTITGLPSAPTYPFPTGTGPYGNSVSLNCSGAGAPATCTLNPTSPAPGTPFTVTAKDVAGDYTFTLDGLGNDLDSLQHSSGALTLHMVSLAVSAPAPITTGSNSTSAASSFNVTTQGTFPGNITLSCTNLPAGASCIFSPSNTVNPTNGIHPVSVQVVTSGTLPNDYTPSVSADPGGGLAPKTVPFTLHVQDYSIALNPPTTITVAPGATANYTGVLTSLNNYVGSVSITCVGAPGPLPSTCTDAASPHALTANGTINFTVNASNTMAAPQFVFNVQGSGPAPGGSTPNPIVHIASSGPARLNVGGFSLSAPNPTTVTAVSGNPSGPSSVVLSTTGAFAALVTLTCPTVPTGVTCNFYPSSTIDLSGPPVTVTVTLNTTPSTPLALGQSVTIRATDSNGGIQNQTLKLNVIAGTAGTDLGVVVSHLGSPDPILVGQPAKFDAHIVNHGPNSATGIVVLFDFSQPVAILGTAGGTCSGTGPVRCTVSGTLLSGGAADVRITVSTSFFMRKLIATAQVSSSAAETAPANNVFSDTALVRLRPWKPSGTPPIIP